MAYDLTPVNYSTSTASTDPTQGMEQGIQIGSQLQTQNIQNNQQQTLQNFQKDASQLVQQGAPLQGIAQLSLRYPMFSDQIKNSFGLMNQAQQDARFQHGVQTLSALATGRPDIAIQRLQDQRDALMAAGRVDEAQGLDSQIKLIQSNPTGAIVGMGFHLAAANPDKFAEIAKAIPEVQTSSAKVPYAGAQAAGEAAQAVGKGQQETAAGNVAPTTVALNNANVSSQIAERAAKLGIERDTLTSNTQTKLAEINAQYGAGNPETQKLVNSNVETSVAAQESAKRFNDMADQIEGTNGYTGKVGQFSELLKQVTGNQNALSAIRAEYARIRGQGIAANLPPQIKRLTDSDLKVFGAGIPDDTAPPAQQAAFLRSIATLKQAESLNADATSQWAAANRTLGPAKQDITIGGVTAAKGTTLPEFTKQYVTQGITAFKQNQVNTKVQNSPAGKYLFPQAQPAQTPAQVIPPGTPPVSPNYVSPNGVY